MSRQEKLRRLLKGSKKRIWILTSKSSGNKYHITLSVGKQNPNKVVVAHGALRKKTYKIHGKKQRMPICPGYAFHGHCKHMDAWYEKHNVPSPR